MSNPLFSPDKDQDGKLELDDLEGREYPDVQDFDDGKSQDWDSEVPDERDNIRRLKKLQAEDILLERARRREEAENDAIIERERKLQLREAHPIRAKISDGAKGIADRVGAELYRYDNQSPRRLPVSRGRRSRATADIPMRRPLPSRQLPPHEQSMSARFTSINHGLSCYANGCSGRHSQGSPSGSVVTVNGGHLNSFSGSLLGRANIMPVVLPVRSHSQSVASRPMSAPRARTTPDLSKIFGIGNMSKVSLVGSGSGTTMKGIAGLGSLTGKKSTAKGKRKARGISLIKLI